METRAASTLPRHQIGCRNLLGTSVVSKSFCFAMYSLSTDVWVCLTMVGECVETVLDFKQ